MGSFEQEWLKYLLMPTTLSRQQMPYTKATRAWYQEESLVDRHSVAIKFSLSKEFKDTLLHRSQGNWSIVCCGRLCALAPPDRIKDGLPLQPWHHGVFPTKLKETIQHISLWPMYLSVSQDFSRQQKFSSR